MKAAFRTAKTAVIAALLQNEQLSRMELSDRAAVSPAAITEVTQALLQQGLLLEMPTAPLGRRGRPTVHLSLQAAHSCFVGVSLSEQETTLVITDLRGAVLCSDRMPTEAEPRAVATELKRCFAAALRQTGLARGRVRGVGISVPGMVDDEAGVCRYSAGLDWRDVPIARIASAALRMPASVDNDANAVAVGEKTFGRARHFDHFTSVVLGSTIGSAHYMHGMLYRGHDGSAGEIGHITVKPNGMLCRCGRKGCLDTVAGGYALQRSAAAKGVHVRNMGELEALARQGNATASQLLRAAGQMLGSAVANLIHLNNPQAVLFTDLAGFGNGTLRKATQQTMEHGLLPRFRNSTTVLFDSEEADALPRSAASIAASQYLLSL